VIAGVMLEIVKLGFALYARHLGATLSYIYGTVAILPLFMIWIYLAWLIFLFGAELNAALHEVKRHDRFTD
jgi:membrane protein